MCIYYTCIAYSIMHVSSPYTHIPPILYLTSESIPLPLCFISCGMCMSTKKYIFTEAPLLNRECLYMNIDIVASFHPASCLMCLLTLSLELLTNSINSHLASCMHTRYAPILHLYEYLCIPLLITALYKKTIRKIEF